MMMVVKPHRTLRIFCFRFVLASGTCLSLFLTIFWVGSGFYEFTASPIRRSRLVFSLAEISVSNGLFRCYDFPDSIDRISPMHLRTHTITRVQFAMHFWRFGFYRKPVIDVWFPLWIPTLIVIVPTTWMWRHEIIAHRRRPGVCRKCGYDITGLVGKEACPECGTAFPAEISKANG